MEQVIDVIVSSEEESDSCEGGAAQIAERLTI